MRKQFRFASTQEGYKGLYLRNIEEDTFVLTDILWTLREEEVWRKFLKTTMHWDELIED